MAQTTKPICSHCEKPCRMKADRTAGKHFYKATPGYFKVLCPGIGKAMNAPSTLRQPVMVDCGSCRGTGRISEDDRTSRDCMDCRGEGTVPPRPRRDAQ